MSKSVLQGAGQFDKHVLGAGKGPKRPSPPQSRKEARNSIQSLAVPSINWLQSLLVSIPVCHSRCSCSPLCVSGLMAAAPRCASQSSVYSTTHGTVSSGTVHLRIEICCASADDRFKGSAFRKVADIINSYPEKITSGKQVSHVKGVGKGSTAKV